MKFKFHDDFDYRNEKTGYFATFYNIVWGLVFFLKYGKPELVFRFGGGLGDQLICTVLFKVLKKKTLKKIWMMSHYPKLFENNRDIDNIVPDSWRVIKYCGKFKVDIIDLEYGKLIGNVDKIDPPTKHMITEIIESSSSTGTFELKPIFLTTQKFTSKEKFVCMQGTETKSSTLVKNKQWDKDKMKEVSSILSSRYKIIQVGLPGENLLPNTVDMRGKFTFAELAACLKESQFFIGQEGFIMHLARSQDTRSIIIYGGRIKAWQSGYPCNENIETNPVCSPCWQNNHCDYDRVCLKDITVKDLVNAIERIEKRLHEKLETEVVVLN